MSEEQRWAVAAAELILFAAGAIWLLVHPVALRDTGPGGRTYSWARVQLWWWTVVILPSWILIWGMDGRFWEFNATCLILLGLSSTTTVAGRIIDDRDQADPGIARAVAAQTSGSTTPHLLIDILSDEQGISIHRFQALVFNVAFAVTFVVETFSPAQREAGTFPDFDASTLALLGLSSTTYVALKAKEKQPKAPDAANVAGSG